MDSKTYVAVADVRVRYAAGDIGAFLDAWGASDDPDGEAACYTLERLLWMLVREVGLVNCDASTQLRGSVRLPRYAVDLTVNLVV